MESRWPLRLEAPANPILHYHCESMTKIRVLVVVEDDPDMQVLIRVILAADTRLEIVGEAASADHAIALCASSSPGLIILDHLLEGDKTGMEAAPELKQVAPLATILLFSAFDLVKEAEASPAIDAYLKKTDIEQLLPTAQRLLGLDPLP